MVVDDRSSDVTLALAKSLAAGHGWIKAIELPEEAVRAGALTQGRRAGRDVVAFRAGIAALRGLTDVVVKVDADTSFARDYFARLLAEFEADPLLGIAGGVCLEDRRGEWRPASSTWNYVRGASRAYRARCLEQLLPLDDRLGWDAVDAEQAVLLGWHVRVVESLSFRHHRRVGARDRSAASAWADQGALAYRLGYRPTYLVARTLYRVASDPAALAILGGYGRAAVRREPRHPNPAVRMALRRRQRARNLPARARETLARRGSIPARAG
jgi:hypothetical protein